MSSFLGSLSNLLKPELEQAESSPFQQVRDLAERVKQASGSTDLQANQPTRTTVLGDGIQVPDPMPIPISGPGEFVLDSGQNGGSDPPSLPPPTLTRFTPDLNLQNGGQTNQQQPNQDDMGFLSTLGDIGKAIGSVATSIIPGPLDDLAFQGIVKGVEAISGSGGGRLAPGGSQTMFNQPVNTGTPPFAAPGGTFFPDIPGVPDLGDLEQFFRGGTQAAMNGANGAGLQSQVSQLLGSNQIVMEPGKKVINDAPPGYVIVTMPDGTKKAVLKSVARKLGMWKPRKKPPISASDWGKLKAAERVKKKAKRIAETADFVCRKSKR